MPEALALALVALASKMLDLIILVIQDQPIEERHKAWARWFLFWDPVWRAVGLDPDKQPIPPVPTPPAPK